MDKKWYSETEGFSVEELWIKLFNRKIKDWKKGRGLWGNSIKYFFNSGKLVELLPAILSDLRIKTFADIGCGDFLWMNQLNWSKVDYTGYDIVKDLININKFKYYDVKFKQLNIIENECPIADMVFIRSVFIHTTLKDCCGILEKIKMSGSKYLMSSTSPECNKNLESERLFLKKRNLCIFPFNMPEPLLLVPEMDRDDGINNYMGVWKIN